MMLSTHSLGEVDWAAYGTTAPPEPVSGGAGVALTPTQMAAREAEHAKERAAAKAAAEAAAAANGLTDSRGFVDGLKVIPALLTSGSSAGLAIFSPIQDLQLSYVPASYKLGIIALPLALVAGVFYMLTRKR